VVMAICGRACCQPRQEALVRIELVVAGRQQIPATLRRCFRWGKEPTGSHLDASAVGIAQDIGQLARI
jgi:hypothetical protein